ncbi:MAG: ABC transporter permease [Chloroflexi bacterium]|nr:ABC transporter permease [Chloroflexota bacterium]
MTNFYALAWRNLRARLTRTMLTAIGIVLGVAVILAIDITNHTTLASIRDMFDEASGRASFIVEPLSSSQDGFDKSMLVNVRRIPDVILAAPSLYARSLLVSEADQWNIELSLGGGSSAGILFVGVDPAIDRQVRVYQLQAGRFLEPAEESRSVLLTQSYAEKHDLSIGDDLEILTADGTVAFNIVGLMESEGVGRLNNGAVGVIPLSVAQEVFQRGRKIDQIDVVITPAIADSPTRLEEMKTRLKTRLGHNVNVAYPASRGKLISQMLSTYQQGLGFFSVVALFVGAFLIYNAFSMTVIERTHEIGMLRALGAERRQIWGLVLIEAGLLGTIGSAVGLVAGWLLAQGLIRGMSGIVGTTLNVTSIPPQGILTALLVGVGVTLVSAFLPARRASRISPLEALRVSAHTDGGGLPRSLTWLAGVELLVVGWLVIYRIPFRPEISFTAGSVAIFAMLLGAALLVPFVVYLLEDWLRWVMTHLYGTEGLLGSGNVQRARGRTALTVSALMVGVSMVVGLGSISTSFHEDILGWVESAIGGDLYVRSPIPMRPQFGQRLQTVPGVGAITPLTFTNVRLAGQQENDQADTLQFVALEPETYTQVASFQFAEGQGSEEAMLARLSQGNSVFISTVVADKYHLRQGGIVRLETARGVRDFQIAGVIIDFSGQGYVINGSRKDLARYFGMTKVHTFMIKLAPGAKLEDVRADIEDRFGDTHHLRVESGAEFKARVINLMNQSFALMNVLTAIAVVVSALGVVNTLLMNVLERLREIGMLRSLGMTRRQVVRMILAEAGTMGIIGGIFGLTFGFFLSQVFVAGMNSSSGYELNWFFPTRPMIYGVIIALLVSQVAALYPAQRAARVNIVAAIKHE